MRHELGSLSMNEHDEQIVRAFITSARRKRWPESLASARRRPAMTGRLNHCRDIDERFATPLPSNTNIGKLLQSHGAPKMSYVLSCTADIDGQMMPLDEAVAATE